MEREVSIDRISLPFLLVVTLVLACTVAAFAAGQEFHAISRDREQTNTRLAAIETEIGSMKKLLTDRPRTCDAEAPQRKRR
jgi:hypothetical protein